MSSTKRDKFSGQPTTGLFEGQKNCIFFSPALLAQRMGNIIEVQSVNLTIRDADRYTMPDPGDAPIFRFGPHSSSRTNNPIYRTQFKTPSVTGTLTQTIPPGPTVVFKLR